MKKRNARRIVQLAALSLALGFASTAVTTALLPPQATEVQAKKKIGKKKAKNIALKDAGLKKSEVSYMNVRSCK